MITLNDYLYSGDTIFKVLQNYITDLREDARKTKNEIDLIHCNFLIQIRELLEHNEFLTTQSQQVREFYKYMTKEYPYLAFTVKGRIKSLIRAEEKFNGYIVKYISDYYEEYGKYPTTAELKRSLSCFRDLIAYRIVISMPKCHYENEEERLQLAVSQRKNLYLKGFVGSTLQNNQWQDLKRASYNGKHEGMLKWLENKNFSSSYQYSLYEKLSQLDDTSQKVEINNTGANKKYLYTPYSVSKKDVSSSLIQKDLNLKSNALFGTKNYSYTETSSVSPSELMTGSDWLNQPNKSQKKYLDTEAVYRQFVYENYQTVDQGLEKTIAHLFDQDEFENTGIYSISQHIRDTLTKYMKYDEKTNTQSENVLEDFLNQKISGNDVLFASAAVEAFRHYNIPARYVEGYLLKSDAIDEEGNATLTSKDGHAWVEVYFDGMGWLPIDVTPGYYYDVYTLMNMVATPQGDNSQVNIEKGHKDSQGVNDGQNGGMIYNIVSGLESMESLVMGVFTIGCVILFIVWICLEIRRLFLNIRIKHAYHRASVTRKVKYLYGLMEMYLKSYGIDYRLGLDSLKVDDTLEKMGIIYEGEFLRVCELFEKSFYGEIELEEFELNIITHFISLLYQNQKGLKWYNKLSRRYAILSGKNIYLKLIRCNEGD